MIGVVAAPSKPACPYDQCAWLGSHSARRGDEAVHKAMRVGSTARVHLVRLEMQRLTLNADPLLQRRQLVVDVRVFLGAA